MKTAMRLFALVILSVTAATWARAQSTEGIKETERFVKTGGATSQAVAEARLKTQQALDAYNAITTGDSKDLKGDYKKLLNAQKDMNNQVAEARKKVDQMDKQAAVYFTSRSTALNQIQDVALRDKAKTRLDESQKEYDKVKVALREGGDALSPLTKDLSDQIKFLGQELNPSSAASLKPQAEKLNGRGSTLFTQADEAVTTANGYFNTLRTE
jgi:chromosome segregation ATPase